jgi:hypothetical protein
MTYGMPLDKGFAQGTIGASPSPPSGLPGSPSTSPDTTTNSSSHHRQHPQEHSGSPQQQQQAPHFSLPRTHGPLGQGSHGPLAPGAFIDHPPQPHGPSPHHPEGSAEPSQHHAMGGELGGGVDGVELDKSNIVMLVRAEGGGERERERVCVLCVRE